MSEVGGEPRENSSTHSTTEAVDDFVTIQTNEARKNRNSYNLASTLFKTSAGLNAVTAAISPRPLIFAAAVLNGIVAAAYHIAGREPAG